MVMRAARVERVAREVSREARGKPGVVAGSLEAVEAVRVASVVARATAAAREEGEEELGGRGSLRAVAAAGKAES